MQTGLGLGANLGDRLAQLRKARQFLVGLSRKHWHADSPLYESDPLDCPAGSPPFLNAVIEIDFPGEPSVLLRQIKQYEQAAGRDPQADRNAPRLIDIDILYFGQQQRDEPGLVLPHPRLARRRFVLQPLAALHPELRVPGLDGSVAERLAGLPSHPGEVRLWRLDW